MSWHRLREESVQRLWHHDDGCAAPGMHVEWEEQPLVNERCCACLAKLVADGRYKPQHAAETNGYAQWCFEHDDGPDEYSDRRVAWFPHRETIGSHAGVDVWHCYAGCDELPAIGTREAMTWAELPRDPGTQVCGTCHVRRVVAYGKRWHHVDGCGEERSHGYEQSSTAPPTCPYCAAGDDPRADGSHELLNVPCGPDGGAGQVVQLALDKQWQRVASALSRQLTGEPGRDRVVTLCLEAASTAAHDRGRS